MQMRYETASVLLIFAACLLFPPPPATAQDIVCSREGYNYESQESENLADLLTCNIIEGDFRISGCTGSYLDFENLAVREICRSLVIQSLTVALRVQFSNLELPPSEPFKLSLTLI